MDEATNDEEAILKIIDLFMFENPKKATEWFVHCVLGKAPEHLEISPEEAGAEAATSFKDILLARKQMKNG